MSVCKIEVVFDVCLTDAWYCEGTALLLSVLLIHETPRMDARGVLKHFLLASKLGKSVEEKSPQRSIVEDDCARSSLSLTNDVCVVLLWTLASADNLAVPLFLPFGLSCRLWTRCFIECCCSSALSKVLF